MTFAFNHFNFNVFLFIGVLVFYSISILLLKKKTAFRRSFSIQKLFQTATRTVSGLRSRMFYCNRLSTF